MLRPADFTKANKTVNIAPYQIMPNPDELPERGSSNGGVFHRGQIVWTRESPAPMSIPHTAIGYVDGLGHVMIDCRVLRDVEAMQHRQN